MQDGISNSTKVWSTDKFAATTSLLAESCDA
jgi:hypothetical protein